MTIRVGAPVAKQPDPGFGGAVLWVLWSAAVFSGGEAGSLRPQGAQQAMTKCLQRGSRATQGGKWAAASERPLTRTPPPAAGGHRAFTQTWMGSGSGFVPWPLGTHVKSPGPEVVLPH